jgi:hypothetical protein
MIDIANGCAKRIYKSDFWGDLCINHHYCLICTQGTSEGLGCEAVWEGHLVKGVRKGEYPRTEDTRMRNVPDRASFENAYVQTAS